MARIVHLAKKKTVGIYLGTVLACAAPLPAHAVCPPYAEAITKAATVAAKAALESFVNQIYTAFTDQIEFFQRMKISSLKVVTSQVSLAAKMQIKAQQSISTAEASALSYLESSKQQLEVFRQFSPQTGQGADPCGQMKRQKAAIAAATYVSGQAAEYLQDIKNRYGDVDSQAKQLLKQRMEFFASADEQKLNNAPAASTVIDNKGNQIELAAADTNAATLFAEAEDERVRVAKKAFISYLSGPPDVPLAKSQLNSNAGRQYLYAKARKDAMLSVGQSSLARVASEYDPNHEIGEQSMMGTLSDVVGTYFGVASAAVHQAWTSQSERGLALDALKMSSAALAVEVNQLEQAQRIEALVAALVAQEANSLKALVDEKSMAVIDHLTKSPVE